MKFRKWIFKDRLHFKSLLEPEFVLCFVDNNEITINSVIIK